MNVTADDKGVTLRTIIVDHDPTSRRWTREQLQQDGQIEVVAEVQDGFEAVQTIDALRPDLLFLDVQMPGLDGFAILQALESDTPPAVVFLTASERHALRAFEVHAIDYLLKPVSPERLQEALDRAKTRLAKIASQQAASELVDLVRDARRYPEWLLIKAEGRSHFVRVRDIDWVESKRNNVLLHVGTASYLYHDTTSGITTKLDPARFLRIHRSTIVNIDRIKELSPLVNGDYAVTLKTGIQLTMSDSYKRQLKAFRKGAI